MKLFFAISTMILLGSCISSKRINNCYTQPIDTKPFEHGVYSNHPHKDSCDRFESLLEQLSFKTYSTVDQDNWEHLSVELIRQDKSISIKAYNEDSIVYESELRGKWKEDVFHTRHKILPIGLPFLYFHFHEKKLILKWTKKEILVLNGESRGLMIFLFAGGMNDYTWHKYKETE